MSRTNPMSPAFTAALAVETRKVIMSPVTRTTTVLVAVGIAGLAGGLAAAAEAGDEQVLAQLGSLADEESWSRLAGIAAQVTAAGGLIGFGVVLAWMFGREFAEGTIGGLFALPVPRSTIAAAKVAVFVAWTAAVAVVLTGTIIAVGLALQVGAFDAAAARSLGRLLVLTVVSGLLAVPAAWITTVGRDLLPGIATTVVTVAVAQVMAAAGTGAWFPVVAPALWAINPGEVSAAQLALVPLVPLTFGALTLRAWSHLQLDR